MYHRNEQICAPTDLSVDVQRLNLVTSDKWTLQPDVASAWTGTATRHRPDVRYPSRWMGQRFNKPQPRRAGTDAEGAKGTV
ncbi:hypothetical protein PHBOTO_003388 [Pseudozyma hubeiensis]|nr:hypothetical protein PHBOTO_003388 [Pseudozyma hubeiensis]